MDAEHGWAIRLGQVALGVATLSLLIFCIVAPGAGAVETQDPGRAPAHTAAAPPAPPPYAAEAGGFVLPVHIPPILFLVLPPGFMISLALAVVIWMARPSQAG